MKNHDVNRHLEFMDYFNKCMQSEEPINTREFTLKTLELLSHSTKELSQYQNALVNTYRNAVEFLS